MKIIKKLCLQINNFFLLNYIANVIKALEDETEDLNLNQNSSTSTETHHGNYNNRDGHKNK